MTSTINTITTSATCITTTTTTKTSSKSTTAATTVPNCTTTAIAAITYTCNAVFHILLVLVKDLRTCGIYIQLLFMLQAHEFSHHLQMFSRLSSGSDTFE